MDYPNEKGVTNRKHLNQVWEQTGVKPQLYKDINVPEAGEDLWIVFWELRNSVEEKISWSDIYHYCLLNKVFFNSIDLNVIQSMNAAANKWIYKKHKERMDSNKPKKLIKKKR